MTIAFEVTLRTLPHVLGCLAGGRLSDIIEIRVREDPSLGGGMCPLAKKVVEIPAFAL